jgi:hypothetical protein
MTIDLIHDRGRGPELVGTRITVYTLLPHFLDPTATEAYIGRLYNLAPEQVAAARAFVLANPDTVLAEHLRIEARLEAGNPPEVVEQAKRTHATFLRFKEWLAQSQQADTEGPTADGGRADPDQFPTFREWLTQQESRAGQGA